MVKGGPVAAITKLNGWPVYRVEEYIVFTHELIQVDVLLVEPPLFPLRCIIGRYAGIANRGVVLRKAFRKTSGQGKDL
jgi:hypothetical protein